MVGIDFWLLFYYYMVVLILFTATILDPTGSEKSAVLISRLDRLITKAQQFYSID